MKKIDKRNGRHRERHGMRWTKIYIIWLEMTARCRCKNNKNYMRYGGRGIVVCDEWAESFIAFYNDMSDGYLEGLHIDRIDNDGPYSKENCRWVNHSVNMANRRNFGKYLKGVVGRTSGGKYISRITIESKKYQIGVFETELEAHEEFNKVHKEWYGF